MAKIFNSNTISGGITDDYFTMKLSFFLKINRDVLRHCML